MEKVGDHRAFSLGVDRLQKCEAGWGYLGATWVQNSRWSLAYRVLWYERGGLESQVFEGLEVGAKLEHS